MPWKNADMIQYIPFFGMIAGKPVVSRSIIELAIVAILPIVFGYVFLIPKLEQKIANIEDVRAYDISNYNSSINEMSTNIKVLTSAVGGLKTDIEVIKVSNEFIKEVANTKVKTIEGRLGVIEYELRDLSK